MSATTARTRGSKPRPLWTLGAARGVRRAPIAAGVVLATVITASLSGAGGTTALWTGSVTTQAPPSITSGAIVASLSGFSDLSTSYTSGALDRTAAVTLANAGTVTAHFTGGVVLGPGSSSTLASATTVSYWPVASAAACTPTAVPTGASSGTWNSVPQIAGTLTSGGSAVYCFRTRIPSTSLATSASLSASLRLDLAVPDTGWTSTASASATQSVTADAGIGTDYIDAVRAAGAEHYWRLGEPSGSILYDWAGTADAYAGTGLTRGAAGALVGDANTATTFSGTATGTAGTRILEAAQHSFAVEAWVKTTSSTGGTILGFGSSSTGSSATADRSLVMDGSGRIHFGVNPGTYSKLSSATGFNDGAWHHIVGQLGSNGQELYIDGTRVAQSSSTTAGSSSSGYWRIGGDTAPDGDIWFDGTVDEVVVYADPLTAKTIAGHRDLSGRGAYPIAAADPYGSTVYSDSPSLFWRLSDASGSSTAADASGSNRPGTYSGNVTKPVTGAVASTRNTAASFNGTDGLVASAQSLTAPSTYSVELWFKTTTTIGGKLVGFGNAASGSSTVSDRHIYLQNDGRLTFGVSSSGMQTTTSAQAYNNGLWHHVVATQGPAGMVLYVDGQQVGTNPTTTAQAGTGYWRVGGDSLTGWPNAPTSSYVTAVIDEVAVYPTALTPTQVKRHLSVVTGAPAASFTETIDGMVATLDASASSDYDGSISSYSWNWGDSTAAGSGATAVHGYAAPGTYTVTLTVTDNSGRTDTWSRQITAVDNVAPSTPSAPTVTSNTGTSIGLSWTAATDNVGVTGYDVYRNGVFATTVPGTIWTDTGRTLGTAYSYTIRARDGSGNISGTSAATSVTTYVVNTQAWYQITSAVNGHCLTAGNPVADRPLSQSGCLSPSSLGQSFQFTPTAAGVFKITIRADPTLAFSPTPTTGQSIYLSAFAGGAGQQWKPEVGSDGWYRIIALSTGRCIDYQNVSPGSTWAPSTLVCSPSENSQQLKLVVVG